MAEKGDRLEAVPLEVRVGGRQKGRESWEDVFVLAVSGIVDNRGNPPSPSAHQMGNRGKDVWGGRKRKIMRSRKSSGKWRRRESPESLSLTRGFGIEKASEEVTKRLLGVG